MTGPADRATACATVSAASGPLLVPLLGLLPVLLLANLAQFRLSPWTIAIGLLLTAALAGIAHWSGLGPADLGLGRGSMSAGLRWGGVFASLAAAAYGAALLVPAGRAAVTGSASNSWSAVLWSMLVVIPLGTVIPEELAFRGVLWGLLRHRSGPRVATLASSALFGVWHVAPAIGGGAANAAVSDAVGGGPAGMLFRVGITVLFTAFAGVVLCVLRWRSDSLLAPAIAHWSVNAFGLLFVQIA